MVRNYLSKKFYGSRESSLKSARIIVPLILKLISPKNVIDIGCGTGEFLKVFLENEIEDVLGIDGPWLNKEKLQIPKKFFKHEDLTLKIKSQKKFDLAISLEVAEHLPEKSAKLFIEKLTNLSKVVLFGAAIPLQGGERHLNEQWPEYWEKLFNIQNYVMIDCLREQIWLNKQVNPWYAQNTFLFVEKNFLKHNPTLKKKLKESKKGPISVIHPRIYLPKARIYNLLKKRIPSSLKFLFSKFYSNK